MVKKHWPLWKVVLAVWKTALAGSVLGSLAFTGIALSDPRFGLFEILVNGFIGGTFWGAIFGWVWNLSVADRQCQ